MFSLTLNVNDFDMESDIEASIAGSDVASFQDFDSPMPRRKITYVIGDVTNPEADSGSGPQIVVK
jgi:hypothetical protein